MAFLIVSLVCPLVAELVLQLVLSNSLPRDFDSQVNPWGHGETEGFGDGAKVKLIDIEYITLVV